MKMKTSKKKSNEEREPLTPEEEQVLSDISEMVEREGEIVSCDKLKHAVEILQDEFNLEGKSFSVTSFSDKGNCVKVSMSNEVFDITVSINDPEILDAIS